MALSYFHYAYPFPLEAGGSLPGFTLAYRIGGDLNARPDRVVWVCHALTGNADVPDWWPGLFDEGGVFDPNAYVWVCANMLGSCYGSTNACSENPETGQPWYHTFPALTNRDMVRAFELLREHLGIERIHTLIGGSMGGQHVLEWAIQQPERMERLIPLATNAQHSPWGIAFNETQRMAISQDTSWAESSPQAGLKGLQTARAIAMLSYRAYDTYQLKQQEESAEKLDDYRPSSYQRYQGEKLAQRFHAFAYWTLSKAMDSQHLGRGRGSLVKALQKIRARTLVIGIDSDILFPVSEQQLLAEHIPNAHLSVVPSVYGHDGFLVETQTLDQIIRAFLEA